MISQVRRNAPDCREKRNINNRLTCEQHFNEEKVESTIGPAGPDVG